MEKLFSLFSAIKSSPESHYLIKSQRCKILNLEELKNSKHRRVEKWWKEKELRKLNLLEKEVKLETVLEVMNRTKSEITNLIKSQKSIMGNAKHVKTFKLPDLFDMERGDMKITKKYCLAHKGDYLVYSGKTEDDGIIGMIDRVDYDVKECPTWTADGVYAGTMFLRWEI